MEIGLDMRMLVKCFGGKSVLNLKNDLPSYEAIMSLVNDDILTQINIEKVFTGMHALHDATTTLVNINVFLKANRSDNILKIRRIITYVKSKITVLDFLSGLLASDHQAVADLLLRRIYQQSFQEQAVSMSKVQTVDRGMIYVLVKTLKHMIDSKISRNPLKAIRKIGIEYKNQLLTEHDAARKQKLADKYLAVLAVEIDSDAYSPDVYVSIQALMSEFQHVAKISSCPSLNEGLLNIRLASFYSVCDKIDAAKEMVTRAMLLTENIASCPDLTNIWYEALNVYLCEFEKMPNRENMNKVIKTGYTGIQTTTQFQFDLREIWLSHFLIRMAFACLRIGIRGNIIQGSVVTAEDLDLANVLLAGVIEKDLTMRRKMFYSLAMGRYHQLKNEWPKAAFYIQEAKTLALELRFKEAKYILGCINEHS